MYIIHSTAEACVVELRLSLAAAQLTRHLEVRGQTDVLAELFRAAQTNKQSVVQSTDRSAMISDQWTPAEEWTNQIAAWSHLEGRAAAEEAERLRRENGAGAGDSDLQEQQHQDESAQSVQNNLQRRPVSWSSAVQSQGRRPDDIIKLTLRSH